MKTSFVPIAELNQRDAAEVELTTIKMIFLQFGKLCSHFKQGCYMFSKSDRSGLQAGQFSTRILLIRIHAAVIHAECGLALSC